MDLPNGNRRESFVCTRCNAPETEARPLPRCGGCQLMPYCSKDCQKDDRKSHKYICKEFPVVNGINVLHTTGSWDEHLAILSERATRLPKDCYSSKRVFSDPKVCYTCRESRPDLLTMCKCAYVCYCSKKCAQADKLHKKACRKLNMLTEEICFEHMRGAYPMTIWYALELLYKRNYKLGGHHRSIADLAKLNVHIVTNSPYLDAQAWEVLFHQATFPNLKEMKLIFIIQDMKCNPPVNRKESLTHLDCEHCDVTTHKNHVIISSVYQKPYHMYFSSSEYSEPDIVIVYGITGTSSDIHSEISYRNMTYNQDSILVLTDSTEDLVIQGSRAVNSARPADELVPPMRNRLRAFGSNIYGSKYDEAAINERYYITCLRRK